MTSSYPDIEGQLYTTGAPDATYTEAEARQRAADRREVDATASAAGASALVDAKAYTDQKVSPLATVASVVAGDLQALADAKAYTDAQLAGFNGNGIETVFGTVALDATGEPIREFYTTGTTTFSANGTTVQVGAFTAVVWKRDGSNVWSWQQVVDGWQTPTPTPDTQAPTAGTLAVSVTDVSASLTVSGATDDRGVTGYAFQVDGGAWSSWQTSPSYTATGLSASTEYQFRHKVRDAAGNETLGTVVSETTAAEAPWGQVWADDFTTWADGPIFGKQMQSAPAPTTYIPFGVSDLAHVEAGKVIGGNHFAGTSSPRLLGGQVDLGAGITRISMKGDLHIGGMHLSGFGVTLWGQSRTLSNLIYVGNSSDYRYSWALNDPNLSGGNSAATRTTLPFTVSHTTRARVTVLVDATINAARDTATVTITGSGGSTLYENLQVPVQGGGMFGFFGVESTDAEKTAVYGWEVRAE